MPGRRTIWTGFGSLVALAVGSGYVPDLALGLELRRARAEGLVDDAGSATRLPGNDARRAYLRVIEGSSAAQTLLQFDTARQLARLDPRVPPYLKAMGRASKVPGYGSGRVRGVAEQSQVFAEELPDTLYYAAKFTLRGAKDEESLLAVARMGRHLASVGDFEANRRWASLVSGALDRAGRLGIAPHRVAAAFGDAPDTRAALWRRVGEVRTAVERRRAESGRFDWRPVRVWTEATYVAAWRGALAGDDLDASLRAAQPQIDGAESRLGVGLGAAYADGAANVMRARRRLEEAR